MRKLIVLIVLILILAGAGGFLYHWKAIENKKEIREEALLYFSEEDYQKAAELFEEAGDKKTLFSSDLDRDIDSYLAESYYQLGEYKQAEEIYDGLIRKDSDKAQLYLLKGECLEKLDQPEEAVSCYRTGYEESGDSSLLLKMTMVYIDQKDYEKALACAEEGMEGSGRQQFMFARIVIYEKALDYDSAYEASSEYVKEYPDDEAGKKEHIFLSTRIDKNE